jgi:hypothetical protein
MKDKMRIAYVHILLMSIGDTSVHKRSKIVTIPTN